LIFVIARKSPNDPQAFGGIGLDAPLAMAKAKAQTENGKWKMELFIHFAIY
jgi:hypothetical protein